MSEQKRAFNYAGYQYYLLCDKKFAARVKELLEKGLSDEEACYQATQELGE